MVFWLLLTTKGEELMRVESPGVDEDFDVYL